MYLFTDTEVYTVLIVSFHVGDFHRPFDLQADLERQSPHCRPPSTTVKALI